MVLFVSLEGRQVMPLGAEIEVAPGFSRSTAQTSNLMGVSLASGVEIKLAEVAEPEVAAP